jgi:hypothetical protein
MQIVRWIIVALGTAYFADIIIYNGNHIDTALALTRVLAHGILLGLLQIT